MTTKNSRFDDRLAAYDRFYDHKWAEDLHNMSIDKPKLAQIVFDLCMTLKGTSNARHIPALAVNLTESYVEGLKLHRLDNSQTLKIILHLAACIEQEVVLTSGDKAAVRKAMLDLAENANERLGSITLPFPKQELWESMVKVDEQEDPNSAKNEFRIALLAAERTWYSAIFFAYENFLVRSIACDQGIPVRIGQNFFKSIEKSLGNQLANKCWNEPAIAVIREVRNSLVHAGGRVTDRLKGMKHNLEMIDGEIQILPEDVNAAYHAIKPRVAELVEWASERDSFV